MLENASWTRENRRHFAIVEALYSEAKRPLRTEGWDLRDEREFAAALTHIDGSHLLSAALRSGCGKKGDPSWRKVRSAWKSVSAESGARGSVFLTLATASMLEPELADGIDEEPIIRAREAVVRTYGPPPADLETIEDVTQRLIQQRAAPQVREATERGGTFATDLLLDAQAALSYRGLELAGVEPAVMPGYEPVRGIDVDNWYQVMDLDWRLGLIALGHHWKGAKESFLDLAFG